MDVARTDLNLLRVFDALLQDGNLTRAGYRLGLSQPAMSHSLAKLRKLTGDKLFVRVASGMQPTVHALRIAPSVREGLRLLGTALQGEASFDPLTSERIFHVILSDIGELAYLPRLMQRLNELAPGVSIRVLNLPREAYADAFLSGEADLAIGFLPGLAAGFFQQRLFTDSYVALVREDHPRIVKRLTLAQFAAEAHVVVEPGGSRYVTAAHQTSTSTLIEQHLVGQGLRRRIALRVPHFLVVPHVVRSSDLIATVPRDLIQQSGAPPGVKLLSLPFDAPSFDVSQFWHERSHQDPANRWLRGVIRDLFRSDQGR
jgi:DNA-binding transcriptional LysR family regulator